MNSNAQLTLRLSPKEIYQLDNFLFVEAGLQQAVKEFYQEGSPPFLYLCGEQGTGKTHLCLALAAMCEQAGRDVAYLNMAELKRSVSSASLFSLMQAEVVCVDDVEAIAGDIAWEEALFHAFNELQLQPTQCIIATRNSPAKLGLALADLRSRLATGLMFQLPQMQDKLKQQALIMQAQSRGLILSEEVAQYLLRHYGRDMPSLMVVLHKLDKASLQAQRRLTIPFVREVMRGG